MYAAQAAVQGTGSIGTTQAFTSLFIITLLTTPVSKLLSAIPSTMASLGCYDRIQKFLTTPPREDHRLIREPNGILSMHDLPTQLSELDGKPGMATNSDENIVICVENLSLCPASDSDFALKDLSFRMKEGSFNIVLGPVGVGKSTLLAALLGEVPPQHGSITVSTTHIAFCAQTPWLPNLRIRDAISMTSENTYFNEDWYRTVLRACALDQDLSSLPDGDNTKIGSGSTVLSGGQKARVALARAVYSRYSIILLDGVTSALDTRTKLEIGQRLLGKDGLLKLLGTTIVLAGTGEFF